MGRDRRRRLDEKTARERFVDAKPDLGTIEWRNPPESPDEWQNAGKPTP